MWCWICNKVGRVAKFVKGLLNESLDLVMSVIKKSATKVTEYCGDSKLRKLCVGAALSAAVWLVLLLAPEVVTVVGVVVSAVYILAVLAGTIERCASADGPVNVIYHILVGIGFSIISLFAVQCFLVWALLSGYFLIADAIISWFLEHGESSVGRADLQTAA